MANPNTLTPTAIVGVQFLHPNLLLRPIALETGWSTTGISAAMA